MSDFEIPSARKVSYASNSVIEVSTKLRVENDVEEVCFQLFPGFNKSGRKRWNVDVFEQLRQGGSILDETPDAVITVLDEASNMEKILCSLEFCSALQAGNQAWQRSGRAFSTMRAGCPYLYIVDFVKYELDANRNRKALRMPHPLVPFSYVQAANETDIFVAQVFVRAEEFNPDDPALEGFDEDIFGYLEMGAYLANLMTGRDTQEQEDLLKKKNLEAVKFFAKKTREGAGFRAEDWESIGEERVSVAEQAKRQELPWAKKVAQKSVSQKTRRMIEVSSEFAVGLGSTDLPFALVPKVRVKSYLDKLVEEGIAPKGTIQESIDIDSDLVICLVKGFKPRGDDARPDRGVLPLIAMLLGENFNILTYIYGPMTEKRFLELRTKPESVAKVNGFWKVFLSLSNAVIIDSPEVGDTKRYFHGVVGSRKLKEKYLAKTSDGKLVFPAVDIRAQSVHEDDVDAVLHIAFSNLPEISRFEGLCNPPGGDWSGLSLRVGDLESRWLSLPRVSGDIHGKRPDHVVQLFPEDGQQFILSVESKDRSKDLETDVGEGLARYIRYLVKHLPSASRVGTEGWVIAKELSNIDADSIISGAAFIEVDSEDLHALGEKTKCDVFFAMSYSQDEWHVKVTNCSATIEQYDALKLLFESADEIEGISVQFR
ncbi:hypothetical protein QEU98_06790 [Trueperella pyogenes]|uniref:hypothetical protein n=1 Tax=Trueperella pyogenes TaxID=1661 RepID=UPI003246D0BF